MWLLQSETPILGLCCSNVAVLVRARLQSGGYVSFGGSREKNRTHSYKQCASKFRRIYVAKSKVQMSFHPLSDFVFEVFKK